MTGICIHIIDDDGSFRTAIARLLRANGYETAEYGSADQFLDEAGRPSEGGCIVLDVEMPGLSGPQLQEKLALTGKPFAIIFLTGHADIPTTVRTIKAGAEDFLTKPVSSMELLASIDRALVRLEVERSRLASTSSAQALFDSLTPREREVFEHVVLGRLNKQTAHELGITERTIKAHRQRLFDKLGIGSVAELVRFSERLDTRNARSRG